MNQDEQAHPTRPLMNQSFIEEFQAPLPIRILKKIDIFSFIPVPKDDAVSTKQSLIGTAVFFTIFLAYVIYDFYRFVVQNPPNAQIFYTNLPNQDYTLPKFAITFMSGQKLQKSGQWFEYLKITLTQEWKDKGSQSKLPVEMYLNNFTSENNQNPDKIEWIDSNTKSFYNILRTSSRPLQARGLLYSTSNATYGKIKIQMCNYTDPQQNKTCKTKDQIKTFCAGGRVFLFIENIFDQTDFSKSDKSNSPSFFIYNFFLEPFIYKRVTFNFQVFKTEVEPDFFFRFSTQKQKRVQFESYIQQSSNVSAVTLNSTEPMDMLGIQFQLSPQILNVKVSCRTLIDHVSMWGALWGVLFAIFALFFLSYNKNKFYKKNPEWDRFKKKKDDQNIIQSLESNP